MMFISFDLEATGLATTEDRIVEIGAVRFDETGAVVASFDQLVRSDRQSGHKAWAVHRINQDRLDQAQPTAQVLAEFGAFLGEPADVTLLAHNAAFDAGLLGAELIRSGLPLPASRVIDTLAWARRSWPGLRTYRLSALAQSIGVRPVDHHRALVDSDLVRLLFLALRKSDPIPPARPPLAYPIYNPWLGAPVPLGWEAVESAIRRGAAVEISYAAGSRGSSLRTVSPIRFEHRGGVAYLAATCHHDGKLKQFQLESVLHLREPRLTTGTPTDPIAPS